MVNNQKVGVVIQARINSSRLPGKVLLPLPYHSDKTLLGQIIARAKSVKNAEVIVATSTNIENDVIEKVAASESINIFRGSENNVLDRYFQTSLIYGLETIVRITADNPFIDPEIIDYTVSAHILQRSDYTVTEGLPLGCNIEVISVAALERSVRGNPDGREKEHVTIFVRNRPQEFKIQTISYSHNWGSKDWRFTIDTESDYALACALFKELYAGNPLFGLKEIAALLNNNPWLLLINKHISQKKMITDLNEEVKESVGLLKKHDLNRSAALLEELIKKGSKA